MTLPLPALAPRRLHGREPFHVGPSPLPFIVGDLWCWAASDLASNTLRGGVVEYLVGRALGLELTVRPSGIRSTCKSQTVRHS